MEPRRRRPLRPNALNPARARWCPVGTVAPSQVTTSTVVSLVVEATVALAPTGTATSEPIPIVTRVLESPAEDGTRVQTSKRTITGRTVLTDTDLFSATEAITRGVVIVQSGAEVSNTVGMTDTVANPESAAAEDGQASVVPIPAGLADLTDVITSQMLADQVRQDAPELPLSGLVIDLSDRGFVASARMGLSPSLSRPVLIRGDLAVVDHSLVVQVESILYGDSDVTSQYRSQVEDRINSSLYRLLPQRYVTGYEVEFGQLNVLSKGPSE